MTLSHWFRLPYVGAGPILVSVLITAAVMSVLWPVMHGIEVFPDPVASSVAWGDIYKARDFKAIELAVGLTVVLSILLAYLCRSIAGTREELYRPLNELLLVSLIPAAWRVALACSIPVDHFPPFRFLSSFALAAIAGLFVLRRYRSSLQPDQILIIGGGILVTILLSIFAGLAFPTAISRVIPSTVFHLQNTAGLFSIIGVSFAACAMIALCIITPTAELFQQRLLTTIKCVQLSLPLMFFYMIPPQLIDAKHRFDNPYPTALVLTLAICAMLGWLSMWWRFCRPSERIRTMYPLSAVIAPVSIACIVMFVYCGSAGLPEAPRDYFHYGEQIVPWQQWWDFGRRPYVDYVPVHGLMAFMRGFFSEAFFHGTIASYTCSDIILTGVAAVAMALAMSMLTTPLGALFLLLGYFPYLDRMYFLAPALFVISAPSLLKKKLRLLFLWMLICVLMVAYNPAIGPAFVLGTIPFGLWLIYRLCRENPIGLTGVLAAAGCIAGACWMILPLRAIEVQFVRFVLDNAWTNEIAHAFAWEEGYNKRETTSGIGSTQLMFETVRCAWAIVALVSAMFFWQEFRRKPEDRRSSLMVLAGSAPLAMLFTVPWILGRIDGGSLGRTGSLSHAAIYTILPALVMLHASRERLIQSLLLTAIVVGYLYPSNPAGFDPDRFMGNAVEARIIPDKAEMVDGRDIGIRRLGQVIKPEQDFLSEIVVLKKALNEILKPGETYLDLTNQTLLYYYVDLPAPARYAPFVAANSRLQAGELQQLKAHPVPAVMIWPAGWIDEVPVSMRCYELYHQYILKYVAVQYPIASGEPWTFLVDPARAPNAGPIGSEEQLAMITNAFSKPNLLRLPVTWGQSWDSMKYRFDHVANIKVDEMTFHHDVDVLPDGKMKPTGPTPYWEYLIPKEVPDGATADFVRIAFDEETTDSPAVHFALSNPPLPTPAGAEPAMSLRWVTNGTYSAPIEFKARPGNLVIPLGAYPRWLLGKSPMTFRLDYENPRFAKSFKISEIEFLRLKIED